MTDDGTRRISLSKGFETVVDAEDYEWLSQWKWTLSHKPFKHSCVMYAYRLDNRPDGRKCIRMHRVIMGAPAGMEVDHIDHDGLNNRRANLRLVSHAENVWHGAPVPWGQTGYWGVSPVGRKSRRWLALIGHEGRRMNLGRYDTPEDAARAYDEAARKYHGEFAKQNFPEGVTHDTATTDADRS